MHRRSPLADMTDETVECFNCGRPNPEWAQVCRSCGVPLRHGQARTGPTGRFPTDRDSLISIGAVVATILGAVLLGLFVSSLNPTDPTVVQATPSPTPSATPEATATPEASATPEATATAAPEGPPGTLVFGTELDENDQVVDPVDTFAPGMVFAHSISVPEPFGESSIGETVVRVNDSGTYGDVLESYRDNRLTVSPEATSAGFSAGDAASLIAAWGPGLYEMRVYLGNEIIGRAQFRLSEG
jgi:hypothetical protein